MHFSYLSLIYTVNYRQWYKQVSFSSELNAALRVPTYLGWMQEDSSNIHDDASAQLKARLTNDVLRRLQKDGRRRTAHRCASRLC